MRDAEHLGAQEYVSEPRQLVNILNDATSRTKALDHAEQPTALTRAEVGLNLNYLVWLLEQATEEGEETLRAAELVLAIEEMLLDN